MCEITCINEEKVSSIQNKLSMENPFEVAKVFKALWDDTRIKIAYALAEEVE